MHSRTQLQKALLYGLFVCVIGVLAYHENRSAPYAAVTSEILEISQPENPVTATAWGIFDPETGKIITSQNADTILPIASLTKLFTAAVVMESSGRDDAFRVVVSDVATEGRSGSLTIGDEVTLYTLLFPLLIESSNDAAAAIERRLGADAYMQSVAHIGSNAGLSSTTITEASGLDPKNVSTVRDLANLFLYVKRMHPHLLDISQLPVFIGKDAAYHNNDPAREFASFRGGKHGYTIEAGRTFVGMFSVPDSDASIGLVLLDSSDIRSDISALLSHGEAFISSGILVNTTSHTP